MSANDIESARPAPLARDVVQRRLLQSAVELVRIFFHAAAASVFLADRSSGELVFEAVAGEGEDHLTGTRLTKGTGIAGWVAASGQLVIVDDVAGSSLFAREAAESTGYVPRSIMAAPLLLDGECIGVLEVLDRNIGQRGQLADIDTLGLLATKIAASLELLVRLRWISTDTPLDQETWQSDAPLLQRLADRLPTAPPAVAVTVTRLLGMADDLLAESGSASGTVNA